MAEFQLSGQLIMQQLCSSVAEKVRQEHGDEAAAEFAEQLALLADTPEVDSPSLETTKLNQILKKRNQLPNQLDDHHLLSSRRASRRENVEALYVEIFNKSCLMMLPPRPSKPEHRQIDPMTVHTFVLRKFESVFLSVQTFKEPCPLYLALSHSDRQGKGFHVYLSARDELPCEASHDLRAYYTSQWQGLITFNSYRGQVFEHEFVYVAIYCNAISAEISLSCSFKTNAC